MSQQYGKDSHQSHPNQSNQGMGQQAGSQHNQSAPHNGNPGKGQQTASQHNPSAPHQATPGKGQQYGDQRSGQGNPNHPTGQPQKQARDSGRPDNRTGGDDRHGGKK